MPHLVKWNEELGDYGVVFLGSHVQQGTKDEIKAKAASLGVTFAIASQARVKDGDDFSGIPHCMIFDHTGKCVFRGHPMQAEKPLRAAVSKAFGQGIETPAKPISSLLDSVKSGQAPAQALKKAIPLTKSAGETGTEAKTVVHNMLAGAQAKLDSATEMKESDPLTAYGLVERLPLTFKGTAVGDKATALITELKKDKTVSAELKARPSLEAIKKTDLALSQMAARAGVEDLTTPAFLKPNQPVIAKLKKSIQQMNKAFPDAKATEEANAIGAKYGVSVK